MGKKATTKIGELGAENGNITDTAGKGSGSDDTRADTAEKGRGRTDTAGNGKGRTDTTDTKGKSGELLELAEVEGNIPTPEAPKKTKKRGRKKKVTKSTPVFSSEQIKSLLMVVTGIFSSREGMEVFALSESEAEQIAVPLSEIIVDTGCSEAFGKYGNYISLTTAILLIFIPKIMIYMQMQKLKKIEKNGGLQLEPVDSKKSKNEGSNKSVSGGTSNGSGSTAKNDDKSLLSSIPALA